MFTTESIDYSLTLPTRCLSSLPRRTPSSKKSPFNTDDDDDDDGKEDDGWDEASYNIDNDDDGDDAASGHRFLVGSACPSIITSAKLQDNDRKSDKEDVYDEKHENEQEDPNNHLHVLTYHEDWHEIALEASYEHPTGEIWSMAVHPRNGTVATCGGGVLLTHASFESDAETGKGGGTKLVDFVTKVWKLHNDEGSTGDEPRLEPLVTIPHGENLSSPQSGWEKRVGCILWNPLLSTDESTEDGVDETSLLTVGWEESSPISLWDISTSAAVEVWSTSPSSSNAATGGFGGNRRRRRRTHPLQNALPRRASWDPHNTHNILCTSQQDVLAYDTRCSGSKGATVIRSAHRYGVADVDHNRLQENVVVTSGLDGVIKFWDLRMHCASVSEQEQEGGAEDDDASFPPSPRLLKTLRGGHSHWATRVVYNPFYDQLVLSGGTDGIANLWRVSSCSSAPLLEFDGEDEDIDNNNDGEIGEDALDEDVNDDNAVDDDWAKEEKEDYIQDNPLAEQDKQIDEKRHDSTKRSSNDVRVAHFECSDTTADVCWSASDPWIYATLSYDGSLVVHHVPSKEKYKILL
ncbi:hypothetical protein HJC23_004806 [Cyclotella cryptica]|uniref:WD40 repeat-like protein n=1 Tax=Cyclotella cryptica TaxID=29204 RepID=A0ABD3PYR7_9STRA|eukprot:CCRYP_010450-RA/>CCRYP_010450-RA protein AED:0.39 eAED:0.39 QI:0/-1/0/1/-1/1/1/0/575